MQSRSLRVRPTRRAYGSCGRAEFRLVWSSFVAAPRVIEEAAHDGAVGVDAAVAQEGPVAARVFEQAQVDFADEDLFLVMGRLGDNAAKGVGEERSSPELKAWAFHAIP